MRTLRPLYAAIALLCAAVPARADNLLPADRPMPDVVDHYVDDLLKQDNILAAPQADAATLIRRLTLDLVGRVPTAAEADAYVASTDPDKRTKLVDRLMASPGFVRHQATQFDAMLNSVLGNDGRVRSIREYLQTALADGKPWDKIFRELMIPNEDDPKQKGASEYLRGRVTDLDRLTTDVSAAFFGVNISCAQCHDHPLVADWKQDHFYGMKSFFARSFDANGVLAERDAGLIKFKPTKGPERTAKLMFLTGATVDTDTLRELTKEEQKREKELTDKKGDKKGAKKTPAPPKFSARAKLVEVSLKPGETEFFAKSIANRMWHRFFGYGLVNPLDQMHSENPPSHPDLLAWLARDTAAHGYDLKRLVRGIVMSRAYSRSSVYPSASVPASKYFAVARLKPLTPMQLSTALKLVVVDPASFEKQKPEELEKKFEGIESGARGWANSFAQPTDDFQIGVGEALLFSNSGRVYGELLSDNGGTLLGRVKALKDPKEAVALMIKTVYTRPATESELTALSEYVRKRNDRPSEAYKQVLWALLTSAEFRFAY
ncbi:DUF1549 domain-containing protein [Fimbriiglobus ruber]|uniref:DUF1549 domain-containing protein n=1 Tax=Fimbriiglobus ruber TaxID=1908690 RepID=A0A225DH98_9BACT|nr:DUF1549 domain-containing protein [Fimbriiglobus ruber]OWK39044.1 hypothetical protein FRUB_06126 [Fimbriiglobus ruber]